jgi:hypothetical protein
MQLHASSVLMRFILLLLLLLVGGVCYALAAESIISSEGGDPSSSWVVVNSVNAAPGGGFGSNLLSTNCSSVDHCRSLCEVAMTTTTPVCQIFTFNSEHGHCFGRSDGIWAPFDDNNHVVSGCNVAVLGSVCPSATPILFSLPLLFMNKDDDIRSTYGRLEIQANSVYNESASLTSPPVNYTGGATAFATFVIAAPSISSNSISPGVLYEVFVAVGRPGEPIQEIGETHYYDPPGPANGVAVLRFVTQDFVSYPDPPVTVLYLPDGSGSDSHSNDGSIWTIKSLDRDVVSGTYLMMASYGSSVHTFRATWPSTENAFKPTTGDLKVGNFKDHDDANVIFHQPTQRWVEMQIMYQIWDKKYCDNVNGHRRVVSVRTSTDGLQGRNFTDDWGCLDHPQTGEHCTKFNLTAMVTPGEHDPLEMEFYRIRPFYLETATDSIIQPKAYAEKRGRIMAHTLLYVPSPSNIVLEPGYGRQPLWYCKEGCCHGPHMYEEWWVGPSSSDPTLLMDWTRPAFDTHAFPHDVWAMAQPVLYNPAPSHFPMKSPLPVDKMARHIWITSGTVFSLPMHRIVGIFTPGNGEFTTKPFAMPDLGKQNGDGLVINAAIEWPGGNHVGGADEGRQAYVMVELRNATTGKIFPGFEKEACVLLDASGVLPLTWNASITNTTPADVSVGSAVQLRIYFRAATIYSIGMASTYK